MSLLKKVDGWLKKKGDEYKANAPERAKKRQEKLEQKLALQKTREEIALSKINVATQRTNLQERRRKLMPTGVPTGIGPFFEKPKEPEKKKKKKFKKKKRKK